jgi:surface protein
MDIQNWGIFEFATSRTFQGCLNLFVTAEDNPIIATTNFNSQFESCKIGNPNWSDWDMSSVTDFSAFAKNAYAFNADISGWDTGSVTNASSMFVNAYAFNADISGWNTSSLGNASYMFEDARAFNQNIGLWNTSSIYNMRSMLQQTNSFDQDLSGWDINQVSNLVNFLYLSGLSTANYDALLIAWDAQGAMSFSGTAHFGSSKYTSGGAAEAARTSLISKWGGIIDGGAA